MTNAFIVRSRSGRRARLSLIPALGMVLVGAIAPVGMAQAETATETTTPDDSAVVLPELAITDTQTAPLSAVSEGSGTYAPKAATVAGKVPAKLKDIPNSVSVITREQLDDQNLTDVDHALAWAPGVTVRPNDNAQSWYQSRGYALSVMHDGMPTYDGLSGYQQFDTAVYDRIEVLRGPSGLLQGSSDPAGSVNLVRKRPTEDLKGQATVAIGSWDYSRETADLSTPLTTDGRLSGRFVVAHTDRDYFYSGVHSEKLLGYGILEFKPTPDWTFGYSSTWQHDDTGLFSGVPTYSTGLSMGLDRSTNFNTSWTSADWVTHEEKIDAEHRFGHGWSAKIAASWREQKFSWDDGYAGSVNPATYTTTYTTRDAEATYYRKGLDAYVTGPFQAFGREHTLLLGSNLDIYNQDWVRGRATQAGVVVSNGSTLSQGSLSRSTGGETRMTQFGQYGQARLQILDPLTVIVGGRNTSFDSDSRSMSSSVWGNWSQGGKAQNEFTPYGGVTLAVTPETSLYGSYSEIFVPQTATTSAGTTLPPRTGWQTEVGVKNSLFDDTVNASAAVFLLRDVNRAITDPNDSNYSIAAGKVESKGVDLEISGRPLENLKLTGSYTYLLNQYLRDSSNTGGTFTTWEPKHTVKLWGMYSFDDGLLKDFSLGSGVLAKSRTWATSTKLEQDAYAVVDAQIGYKINDHLSADLTVNNVFDTEYWATMRSTTNNMYGEPRSVMLTLKAEM